MYQLRVLKRITSSAYFEPNRRPGDVVWVNDERVAESLIRDGLCAWVGVPDAQPQPVVHTPATEAEEYQATLTAVPAVEPEAPKSAGDRTGGPSTVSPSSNPDGPAPLSSASAAALVSPARL